MASSHSHESNRFVTLDVFTKDRFRGNPLAIVEVPPGTDLGQETKQSIAREFNLSETVFLHRPSSGGDTFNRRCDIFTVTEELPFAGHPTIGTLVYLCLGRDAPEPGVQSLTLQTKAGPISAQFDGKTAEASIPHNVRIHQTPVPIQSILDAQPSLRRCEGELDESFPLVSIVKGMTFVLVSLPQVEDLAKVVVGGSRIDPQAVQWDAGWESFTAPYFYAIVSEDKAARRICVRSRMVEPSVGEDSATGSAASALAAYLAVQRGIGGTTYIFSIEQGVEMGRKSDIGVEVTLKESGESIEKVVLSGSAVLVSQGTLTI